MEKSQRHNGLYEPQHEKYPTVYYDASGIAAYCYPVRAEKVKAVGTYSDRKRKKHGNRNEDFVDS